jgi:hypothetical protein
LRKPMFARNIAWQGLCDSEMRIQRGAFGET